jgi:thermitase
MGRARVCGAVVVALLAVAAAVSAGGAVAARDPVTLAPKGSNRAYVPGEVVVRFRPSADPLSRKEALSAESATTVKRLVVPGLQLVHVDGAVQDAVASFRSSPAVSYAEPNYLYHADAVPNDPRYPQLWALARISAPAAWSITTGSTSVTVGIVDTGISTDHLDLSANVVPGHDFVQGDGDPRDFNGHGTHVAGTIGARGNASLGGTSYSTAMRDAIASCPSTLFVVAAGNDGVSDDQTPHYPCNYGAAPDDLANVICVAATDSNDTLASF